MKPKVLQDLVTFARAEAATRDVEPWADVLLELRSQHEFDDEFVRWVMSLYNTTDSLSSAWSIATRWPSPQIWLKSSDREDAQNYPIMRERRNLYGGRINHRMESYCTLVGEGTQAEWFMKPLRLDDPGEDFERLNRHVRQITQVGRQAAYEFCEFIAKVLMFPVDSTDGHLWESSGPRQSIEYLHDLENPTLDQLNDAAAMTKDYLEMEGVELSWWDFETIICDFKVASRGRYYVGQHLGALKEEILEVKSVTDRMLLLDCFNAVVPEPWNNIPPGIDKARRALYKNTGIMETEPWW